ncbi:MAG TPA: AraC family transcriptional regulator [Gemmataceae bacterium]|nr:AraC family transcriptional regulator [Gemmataceae bacterium]
MSRFTEIPITFRVLHDSPLVRVRDYRCRACRGGPAAEEHSDRNDIVLLRHGAFAKHFGRRSLTADVNHAVFFAQGSTYRVSHPADCGDRGTTFTSAPHVLRDILRELNPAGDDRPERAFSFVLGPCETGVFWRHRDLVQRLESAPADSLDPMWADGTALQLLADVLEAAFARHGLPLKRRRNGTESDHADRIEAAKAYLANRLGERITLEEVARAVHTSPFHLARIFQQRTGVPVHRYLTRLRLRAALERLADGANDLTALALELGFSSHSHFTDAFRREFGCTPSKVRRDAGRRTLREMSKNLKV